MNLVGGIKLMTCSLKPGIYRTVLVLCTEWACLHFISQSSKGEYNKNGKYDCYFGIVTCPLIWKLISGYQVWNKISNIGRSIQAHTVNYKHVRNYSLHFFIRRCTAYPCCTFSSWFTNSILFMFVRNNFCLWSNEQWQDPHNACESYNFSTYNSILYVHSRK